MKFGLVGNTSKELLYEAIGFLFELKKTQPVEFYVHDAIGKLINKKLKNITIPKKNILSSEKLVQQSDIIIALGGDGTILSAARMVGRAAVPILGINLGKLGFLAELSISDMEFFIHDILRNNHVVEERTVVKATIEGHDEIFFALNDIVIDKSSSSRAIHVTAYVNNEFLVSYTGDGLIVSTPTGSTGYALAAGGPIVVPATQAITIQPISPHSLTARSVILPDTSSLRIVVEEASEAVRITADGQKELVVKPPLTIMVQKADYTIKLIKRKDRSYYDVLRTKLMWGKDARHSKESEKKL